MITLKKCELEPMFNLLKATDKMLNLAESRIRDSFLKELTPKLETFYADRLTIYKKFCTKNEDGTPIIGENETYSFKGTDAEEMIKEFTILKDEELTLESNDKLKEICEKSEYKPSLGETTLIDEVMAKL